MYSRPYLPRPNSSLRRIGLSWIRTCAEEHTSCLNPRKVSCVVFTPPPTSARLSNKTQRRSCCCAPLLQRLCQIGQAFRPRFSVDEPQACLGGQRAWRRAEAVPTG